MSKRSGHRGLQILLTLVAAACGVVTIAVAVAAQQSAPTLSPAAAGHIDAARQHPGRAAHEPARVPERSTVAGPPTSIDIPAIKVRAAVFAIGKTPGGVLRVPQEGPNLNKAAWYEGSPIPGEPGPSVIEGHIDTVSGPSVFYRLAALRPGNIIRVARADGQTAVFTVDGVRNYATKAAFPTELVYGGEIASSSLRLITCSNFDETTGHYAGNTVVFAHLSAIRHTNRRNPQ